MYKVMCESCGLMQAYTDEIPDARSFDAMQKVHLFANMNALTRQAFTAVHPQFQFAECDDKRMALAKSPLQATDYAKLGMNQPSPSR